MRIFELSNETWGVSNSARVYLAKDAQLAHSGGNHVLQLLGLLFVFVLVLIAAWYVSRFIGNKTMQGFGNKNINIIETFNMGNNLCLKLCLLNMFCNCCCGGGGFCCGNPYGPYGGYM